jgi:hypothetical protein
VERFDWMAGLNWLVGFAGGVLTGVVLAVRWKCRQVEKAARKGGGPRSRMTA